MLIRFIKKKALTHWRRLRTHWNWTDTLVFGGNTIAFFVFIGNCWWQSVWVVYGMCGALLLLQGSRAVKDLTLRRAFLFGALVGLAWPLGESLTMGFTGWWGTYTAPGLRIIETPIYCVLVGWLASTHIDYLGRRTEEMGWPRAYAIWNCGSTAFLLGLIGENQFVAAGMWEYESAGWDWWHIPAFLPIAYGFGYAIRPFTWRWGTSLGTAVFCVHLTAMCMGIGYLAGFFPR